VVLLLYGRLEEAEKTYLRIVEEIGGSLRAENILTLPRTLGNLAAVKWGQYNYQEAEMLLRQALHGQEQALDDSDSDVLPWLLHFCNNLAVTLNDQNKAKEARDLQERVVEKVCEVYDIGNPIVNSFQRNLEWIQR
jgi:tetratricopeptide (TPR) repeat protein